MKKLMMVFIILGVLVNVSCMGSNDDIDDKGKNSAAAESSTALENEKDEEDFSASMKAAIPESVIVESYGIDWETKTAAAYARAEQEGKNVFVLITAPSWCHWCQELEKNVLSDSKVISYIADEYVPLLVLDVVDGQRNPELENFVFSGFPTVRIYDFAGDLVGDVYTQDADQMLAALETSVDKQAPKAAERYSVSGVNVGELIKESKDTFIFTGADGVARTFLLAGASDGIHFYIYEEASGDYIAVPFEGGDAHVANNSTGEWTDWSVFGAMSIEN